MHLNSYSSDSGAAADLSTEGQSEGAKRPSGGKVWEGGFPLPPTVGRFFENSCMKTKFLAH